MLLPNINLLQELAFSKEDYISIERLSVKILKSVVKDFYIFLKKILWKL